MKKARIALVGVSGFGNVHYEDIMRACKAGRADIICATVINQQEEPAKCAALRSMGCTVFDDAAEMFQSFMGKVDLCFLPVGIGFHAPMTIAALENGMNVVLEKPLTATVQEADAIIDASKRTRRFVAIAYQHMYQPQIKSIKQAIISGEIGALKTVRGIGLWPRGKAYYARNNWAGKLRTESGWVLDSPVNNALAHYMNMVCYFGGETLDGMAQINSLQAGLYRANPEIENFDTGFIGMTTPAGVKLLFVTSHAPQSTLDPIVEAVGEKKLYSLDQGIVHNQSRRWLRGDCSDAFVRKRTRQHHGRCVQPPRIAGRLRVHARARPDPHRDGQRRPRFRPYSAGTAGVCRENTNREQRRRAVRLDWHRRSHAQDLRRNPSADDLRHPVLRQRIAHRSPQNKVF